MNITFNLEYFTRWGENLAMELIQPDGCIYSMHHLGNGRWTITLPLQLVAEAIIEYRYLVVGDDGSRRVEHGTHTLEIPQRVKECFVYDHWQERGDDAPFFTKLFTDCIMARKHAARGVKPRAGHVMIEVEAPLVEAGQSVALVGSSAGLGAWNTSRPLRLNDHDFPSWKISLPIDDFSSMVEYKFIIIDDKSGEVITWEQGANRYLEIAADINHSCSIVVNQQHFRYGPQPWHGTGVAIPVFSLRSEADCGVGDFHDLKLMIDWAARAGMKIVQVLPINDTTMTRRWTDSYPYNANSTFALHPMYLRLEEVGRLKDRNAREAYEKERHALNALEVIDYEAVNRVKTAYLEAIYEQEGKELLASADFARFYDDNRYWLRDYAAFNVLRDLNDTADFSLWGDDATFSPAVTDRIERDHPDEYGFILFQQYHLDRQLREVKEYAVRHGVGLKGDIPIGISRTSVDAWTAPELFNLDSQAGAPPDDFSIMGQNWGFPTYNWERMALDGYRWWRNRFTKMAQYFDAYRIDHVLGFFRIWEIPTTAIDGLLGYFSPALPLSPEQIAGDWGFTGDVELLSRPAINDAVLEHYLAGRKNDALPFLLAAGNGNYNFKPQYDTQMKLAAAVDNDTELQRGLLNLFTEVLFIADPHHPGLYHPRIDAAKTLIYSSLTEANRVAFDALYEDFFYHRHNDFWRAEAMKKLPVLVDSTGMLTCAEDLGMIPSCVPSVMDELKILSLEIQRMPKEFGVRFGDPARYPYLSVCTTSTHDMEGIRQWWEEDPERATTFYNEVLHQTGKAPLVATPDICRMIIDNNLATPAMLTILPWQDWMSTDGTLRRRDPAAERINLPACSRHYWRYRMHLTLESLL